MTLFEARAGKKLSKKNASKLAKAHAILTSVLGDADPADLLPEAGPTATEGMNYDQFADGSPGSGDATGSRVYAVILTPLTRAGRGQLETR